MATFSAVTRQHLLPALDENATRGGEKFLGCFGFAPAQEAGIEVSEQAFAARDDCG